MYVFLKATSTVQEHAGILAEVAGLSDVAGVARVVEELEPKMQFLILHRTTVQNFLLTRKRCLI